MNSFAILLMTVMLSTVVFMAVAERIWPARQFPTVRGWVWIGIGVMVLFFTVANTGLSLFRESGCVTTGC